MQDGLLREDGLWQQLLYLSQREREREAGEEYVRCQAATTTFCHQQFTAL